MALSIDRQMNALSAVMQELYLTAAVKRRSWNLRMHYSIEKRTVDCVPNHLLQ